MFPFLIELFSNFATDGYGDSLPDITPERNHYYWRLRLLWWIER